MTAPPSDQTNESSKAVRPTRIQSENQQKILAAALTLFSRYGFRGTTVDQIATQAEMSKANILYYFKRKNDIYVAVLEKLLENWLEPLGDMNADGDPEEELWKYIQAKLKLSAQSPEASRLFATEIIQGAPLIKPFLENELRELVEDRCRVLQHWIDQGRLVNAPPLHMLFLIWAATQHYADFAIQVDALTPNMTGQVFTDAETTLRKVLLNGLLS